MFKMFKKSRQNGSRLLDNVLMPQIRNLESEGNLLQISEVTFIYLMIAEGLLDKNKSAKLPEIKKILEGVLQGEEYRIRIEAGYGMASMSQQFNDLCDELVPIVNRDLSAENPSFLVRYTHHVMEEVNKQIEGSVRFDPKRARKALCEI